MKKTDILERLMDAAGEIKPANGGERNKIYADIYDKLCDLLLKSCSEEQKELVFALDSVISARYGNYFYDGLAAGIHLSNSLKEIFADPFPVYCQLIDDNIRHDSFKDEMYDLINTYSNSGKP